MIPLMVKAAAIKQGLSKKKKKLQDKKEAFGGGIRNKARQRALEVVFGKPKDKKVEWDKIGI